MHVKYYTMFNSILCLSECWYWLLIAKCANYLYLQIGHLAEVADTDIAVVLSWHMSADMDCIVTETTKKVSLVLWLSVNILYSVATPAIKKNTLTLWLLQTIFILHCFDQVLYVKKVTSYSRCVVLVSDLCKLWAWQTSITVCYRRFLVVLWP